MHGAKDNKRFIESLLPILTESFSNEKYREITNADN